MPSEGLQYLDHRMNSQGDLAFSQGLLDSRIPQSIDGSIFEFVGTS